MPPAGNRGRLARLPFRRRSPAPRALLVGWFSIPGGSATAGDLAALDVVRDWLGTAGIAHDTALTRPFPGGVDWQAADPAHYSHVVHVCGPVSPGLEVARVLDRFADCRLMAVNTSMTTHPDLWNPFELLLERDSEVTVRPDLAFADNTARVPVVGVLRAHLQQEYPHPMHRRVDALVDALLADREAAAVPIDTVLEDNRGGLRTPAQVASVIGRTDLVLTTRLHGLVFALRAGVPAVALDPIPGGAKVARQAEAVGWPHVETADRLDERRLAELFDACLEPTAADQARRCADAARHDVERLRPVLLEGLLSSGRAS